MLLWRMVWRKSDKTLQGDKEEIIDILSMSLLEDNEEKVKEGKAIKILTQRKLITRLPVLLAQIKAGNNSNKLKSEIREIVYLLYQYHKITKKLYNSLINSL